MAAAAALLLLAGCGGPRTGDHVSPKVSERAETPPTEEPTPTDAESSKSPEILSLGTSWEWRNGDESSTGKTVVVGWKQPIHSVGSAVEESGEKGYVWGALELKVCTDKGSVLSSQTDWTLAYGDGARVEPSSSTWDDFPKPEFPVETQVRAGDCVRGKLVFPVPGHQQPERVLYAPNGDGASVAEWEMARK
ncbi:hypothetical protein ACH4VT_05935 [Streptomyces lydicus]|uniref:hypothetical protein n=1 Tax=Streptomyces lydicus TaxID=47763 RepID=UPI00379EF7D7